MDEKIKGYAEKFVNGTLDHMKKEATKIANRHHSDPLGDLANEFAETADEVKRNLDDLYFGQDFEDDDIYVDIEGYLIEGTNADFNKMFEGDSDLSNAARTRDKSVHKELTISMLGHNEHGKTTLLAAICKVLNKRSGGGGISQYHKSTWNMQKQGKAIPISISYAEYEYGNRYYLHIDCNEHRDYVKRLITGAIDGAILVVAATDGAMAQTREQILLSHLVGVPYIVVFMNKCDVVDDEELLELIDMEIRDLLNDYGFPGDEIPIIQGSALEALEKPGSYWGDKIGELMDAVDNWVLDPVPEIDKPFLMQVEDTFTITGRGTVATGRVERGTLHLNDEIEILGIQEEVRKTVCTGIEMFRKLLDEAQVGDNIGALLRGVQRTDIEKGQVLAKTGSIKSYKAIVALIYVLTADEGGRQTPFFNCYYPQFCFNNREVEVGGVCRLPIGSEMCLPGDWQEMLIELDYPMAMELGDELYIYESEQMVGLGKVIRLDI